uniref:GPI ethanolamine phosphate transferase 1 n=1 Tax=Meloidogyne hapla TaxID=6305 RepID=A0A1I8BJR2_MELHA
MIFDIFCAYFIGKFVEEYILKKCISLGESTENSLNKSQSFGLIAFARNNLNLLFSILLIIVALFSPYPSYAETALYLPVLVAFVDIHKYLRQCLVTGCTILATFILSPIMWSMWVHIGSGNANFFFAIVWIFAIAQIFIAADLISSFLRAELVEDNGGEEEVEKRFEGIKLLNISPFV